MKRLIKIMVSALTDRIIKKRKSKFIDAIDLFEHRHKPVISINKEGKLFFYSSAFIGEITGFVEWETKHKDYMKIKKSCTVIDCIVELENTIE